ncbi:ABC transporter permease [Gilvibacter sp.]|uniref:ABC transporter permease n=1 Tax=Gilvibacter sp. TaxID=2729997 RepID=UPI003B52AD18
MFKIIKYSFFDLMRSRWSYAYLAFYFLLAIVLLFLNNDLSKAVITLMNVITVLVPLIGTVFGIMYYYDSKEFTQLLLAQPIKRSSIFLGQYFGVAVSLSMSLLIGLGIPFVIYGLFSSSVIWDFSLLLVTGVFLTFIFTAISFYIGLCNENKIKGFGYAIVIWLFLAVIFDGILLLLMVYFNDYPLDNFALGASMFNPIDLSRILILLKLDISALLGYTGAVFQKFFGTRLGLLIALSMLSFWVAVPALLIQRKSLRRDF